MSSSSSSSSSSSLKKRKLTLISSDGIIFNVEEDLASEISTLKLMIQNRNINGIIPLVNINASIFSMVMEYCRKHSEAKAAAAAVADTESTSSDGDTLEAWDAEFMNRVNNDLDSLYDLIIAANFLKIESLMDLTTVAVVNYIKRKSTEELLRNLDMQQ